MGNNGSHFHSLQCCFFSMEGCTSDVWNSLDHVEVCCEINVLLEKLAQESWLKLFEFGVGLFDVDCLEGVESLFVREYLKYIGSIKIFASAHSF